ncbi:MAG TPA: hypothetical protein VF995_07805 [Actinomycetota bacterium]
MVKDGASSEAKPSSQKEIRAGRPDTRTEGSETFEARILALQKQGKTYEEALQSLEDGE